MLSVPSYVSSNVNTTITFDQSCNLVTSTAFCFETDTWTFTQNGTSKTTTVTQAYNRSVEVNTVVLTAGLEAVVTPTPCGSTAAATSSATSATPEGSATMGTASQTSTDPVAIVTVIETSSVAFSTTSAVPMASATSISTTSGTKRKEVALVGSAAIWLCTLTLFLV